MWCDNSFMIKISRIEICVGGAESGGRGGMWWNLIIQMDILGWDGTAITDEEWFVPSSPQLTWWPASVLQCWWWCSATMHAINVSVICIFSATSTPGIFLKSMMLLSPKHALIPILKEQLLTAQSIKFLSSTKLKIRNVNISNPYMFIFRWWDLQAWFSNQTTTRNNL